MSFNNEDNDEFNELIDKRNLDNSFSDLSSISNQSMIEIIKEDLVENIKLTPEKPKKEKKKRKKEDLNKTPLYIFDCVFCANEKAAFKILSANKLYDNYNLCYSRHDYHDINDLVNFKKIVSPSKKLRYYNSN